jgi:plastocyanin
LILALLSVMGFALVIVPVGPAASEEAPAAAGNDEATIDLVAFHARPDRVEIKTGTTVTWVNKETFDYPLMSGRHEIKADDGSFASPSMAPGTRWSHRFNLPGTFTYHCADHKDLVGQIVVTGPPIVEKVEEEVGITETKPDDPTTWGFQPNDLIVTTGMTVVWRNNGTNTHTVTADDKRSESGDIKPGTTWKYRFDEPGVFTYHCTPHPWMKASVRVVVPGGTPPPPPPPVESPAPPAPRTAREAAPQGDSRGPVRHEVDIVENNPADPKTYGFDPPTLDLRAGDTVVWRNTGSMQHSITAVDGSFDSGLLNPGATWSRRFGQSAYVEYRCTPHPWMRGILVVAALTGPPPAPPAGTRTAAGTSVAPAPPQEPVRQGSGPVTHAVNIVEPDISDAMGWGFSPRIVDAVAGDTVVWRNTGTMEHSVTAEAFDAGLIAPAATFSKTFDAPGVYAYGCTPHPWMKGVVRVVSAAGAAVPAIPAGLETAAGGSGPSGPASAAEAVRSVPGHIVRTIKGHGGSAATLGWALLFSALSIGFTMLLSWVWQYPVPAGARIQSARDLIR